MLKRKIKMTLSAWRGCEEMWFTHLHWLFPVEIKYPFHDFFFVHFYYILCESKQDWVYCNRRVTALYNTREYSWTSSFGAQQPLKLFTDWWIRRDAVNVCRRTGQYLESGMRNRLKQFYQSLSASVSLLNPGYEKGEGSEFIQFVPFQKWYNTWKSSFINILTHTHTKTKHFCWLSCSTG